VLFVPSEVANIKLPGRFTERNGSDAINCVKYLRMTRAATEGTHVVIVGGGLLGLDWPAALKIRKC